jgi:deoxyribonuclease V
VDVGIKGDTATAAVVLVGFPDLELVEVRRARRRVAFPYVPGLLSFRECPAILDACRRLSTDVDLLLVDGQGIAHPRRLGCASHLGLLLDRSAIGCAKSLLCGTHEDVDGSRGSSVSLRESDEVIGSVVRTRDDVKPVYVSVGHKITLKEAVRYVLACGSGYRIPEPIRLAHRAASGPLEI